MKLQVLLDNNEQTWVDKDILFPDESKQVDKQTTSDDIDSKEK